MEKEGLFIDKRNDKKIEAKIYFNSDMWEERREEAALYIQRLIRGWFARRRTNSLRAESNKI
jgi:hypothetical protein